MKHARWMAGIVLVLAACGEAAASSIIASAASVSDISITGNVVAIPYDGPRAMVHNPAGVSLVDGTTFTYSIFAFNLQGDYANREIGFDQSSSETGIAPLLWLGTDALAPWHVGVGAYGAFGTSFNFNGDPEAGFPNRFLGESSVITLGIVAGREILPGLHFGIELAPNFGQAKSRFGSPLGPVSWDLAGPGIGGNVGLLYQATEALSLGVGYRSPARVFMSGDGDVGETDDDVDLTLHLPQHVEFGFAYGVADWITFTAQARWTVYEQCEDGTIDYSRTNALVTPFIADARTTFRYGAGVELAFTESSIVRLGVSHEEWMMEGSSLSPLLFDTTDTYVGSGLLVRLNDHWTVSGTLSTVFAEDRVVTADEQTLFPGRYKFAIPITAGFQIDYRFGGA